jgi:hypothetical protein
MIILDVDGTDTTGSVSARAREEFLESETTRLHHVLEDELAWWQTLARILQFAARRMIRFTVIVCEAQLLRKRGQTTKGMAALPMILC